MDKIAANKHIWIVAICSFFVVWLSSFIKGYGYFIDEFYYIACANRPAFGYVDHPPLAPFLLTVFQFAFGSSLYAMRVLPALSAAAAVYFTGVMTKEIGGGKYAQFLAAFTMATVPVLLAFAGFFSMNAFEPLIAIITLLLTIEMIKKQNPKKWILIGCIIGFGLMNKHTFGIFAAALVLSMLIGGQWRLVLNRYFPIGCAIALLIFLPNIIWQAVNNYPSLEFYRNITTLKNIYTPPLAFITGQIITMSPFTFPVWFCGMLFLLFSKSVKEYKFLGILFALLFLFMLASGTSRSDRTAFAYPAVFAGGAVFFELLFDKYSLKWLKGLPVFFLMAGLIITVPLILPYLNYQQVAAYVKFTGFNTEIERGKKPLLPQLLADRIGWEEKVQLVLNAYHHLTPDEQKRTLISAGNYGQAGAIELYGRKDNIPTVVAGHNTYYLWSKDKLHGDIIVRLADSDSYNSMKELFQEVEPVDGIYSNPYVSSHENNLQAFICRQPKRPLSELLARGKFYY